MNEQPQRRLPGGAERRVPAPYSPYGGPLGGPPVGGNGGTHEPEIDWRRWAHVFWRRKWWILLVTALGTASAWYFARGERASYQANAMVWFDTPERNASSPMPIEVASFLSAPSWADLLQSYAVLDGVVDELRLYVQPADAADRRLFRDFELSDDARYGTYRLEVEADTTCVLYDLQDRQIQVARPGEPIGESLGWRWTPPAEGLRPGHEVIFSVRRPRAVADGLSRHLETEMDQGGNFIKASFIGDDPNEAALILNSVLDHFVAVAAELKKDRLAKLAGTLQGQLTQASDRLRHAESELEQYRVNTITLPEDRRDQVGVPMTYADPSGGATGVVPTGPGLNTTDPVFNQFFTQQMERDRLRQDKQDLQRILKRFQGTDSLDVMLLETIPSVQTASALKSALAELGRMELERTTLLYRYTPEHAEVKRATESINQLKAQTIPSLISGLIGRLSERESEVEGQLDAQKSELQDIPPRAIEEARLRREVALAEQVHNNLQVRYKEAQVAEAATQPSVRVLDRAVAPPSSMGSTFRLKVMIGFVLSLGLALVGVIGYEQYVNRRLEYPEQVVGDLGLPILGIVPNLKALKAAPTAEGNGDGPEASGAIESFRALRTQLTHGLRIKYPAVIAITSPSMGEGKSLVTSNLALAFAEPGRPTVLIDGDTRRGGLHRIFQVPRSPGLTDYLRGEADARRIVRRTKSGGLSFVPRGPWSEEIPELMDGEGLPTLLEQLKHDYDIILVDTPPLAAGVDAVLIGAHADAVLAVLRTGRTDLDVARAKIASYAQMLGVPILGAILNDVKEEGPYRYYSYYSYGAYSGGR
ncbi:MAG TPA: polysaccharide biosynthesis tyrosine autokinase [Actinomycetota bacterium]|nr:polysaccharide biosynthesis tyrosine autokinase [Actinomycetota bacterium]